MSDQHNLRTKNTKIQYNYTKKNIFKDNRIVFICGL
jgi:hypothetical protein